MRRSRLFAAGAALVALAALPAPVHSQWTANGVRVCTNDAIQFSMQIAADGSGGAFVVWMDVRGPIPVPWAQRLTSDGVRAWGDSGVQVAALPYNVAEFTLTADGTGGVIVVWSRMDDPVPGEKSIWAQRLTASGAIAPGWSFEWGVPFDHGPETGLTRGLLGAVPDGLGGAYVVAQYSKYCEDLCTHEYMTTANFFHASGSADGLDRGQLVFAGNTDIRTGITINSSGTVPTFAYLRQRDPTVYARRLGPQGWDVTVHEDASSEMLDVSVVPDSSDGAFVTWLADSVIEVKAIDATGSIDASWPTGGVTIGVTNAPLVTAPDGQGGVLVLWRAPRSRSLWLNRIVDPGAVAPGWPIDGVLLSQTAENLWGVVDDQAGGAYVAWMRHGDVLAQHILGSGTVAPGWVDGGRVLGDPSGNQGAPVIAADGAGGAIVVWSDGRSGTDLAFAAKLGSGGIVSTPGRAEPGNLALALSVVGPNPAHDEISISFALANETPAELELFDVRGRLLERFPVSPAPGAQRMRVALPSTAKAGLYFLRLSQGSSRRVVRFSRVN